LYNYSRDSEEKSGEEAKTKEATKGIRKKINKSLLP
jgi:hypothetical protein